MTEIYLLALVIALASGLAILMRHLRQPLIVSYLAAGVVLSAFHLVRPEQLQFLAILPEIGLAFLLFLVGMELDLREFRSLGRNVLLAGLGQVVLTTAVLYFFLARQGVFGGPALVVALALSFSSTVLVVKLLLEEKDLSSLHGKIAVGILLLEDLLAILTLMFLSVFSGQTAVGLGPLMVVFLKGVFLIWGAIFSGRRVLPTIFKWTADNSELLFLTGIGWCLVFVSLSLVIGFSLGVGAFLAGVSLAQSVYRTQISGRIKPLRDFFIMIFFIDLGTGVSFSALSGQWLFVLTILVYTIVIKPLVFFLTLTGLRFRVHTAFQTAVLLSSVSEFSLIILVLGGRLGLVGKSLISSVIFATVLSFVFSSLLVTYKRGIYERIKNILKKVERKGALGVSFFPHEQMDFKEHAILVGCHRSGTVILPTLRRIFGDNLLVVDFNPEVIENLKNSFVPCLYGDISDPEVAELLHLKEAGLVVSTVRDLTDNLALLDAVEKAQSKAMVVVTAGDTKEAITLYERGAHHVSLPLLLEGNSIGHLISEHRETLSELASERERKLGELKRINQ